MDGAALLGDGEADICLNWSGEYSIVRHILKTMLAESVAEEVAVSVQWTSGNNPEHVKTSASDIHTTQETIY